MDYRTRGVGAAQLAARRPLRAHRGVTVEVLLCPHAEHVLAEPLCFTREDSGALWRSADEATPAVVSAEREESDVGSDLRRPCTPTAARAFGCLIAHASR